MHKTHYWVLLKIAKMPKAFTYGTGILVALVLILVTMITTVWLDHNLTAKRHDTALKLYEEIRSEGASLLNHLVQHDQELNCNNKDLMHLNFHLLQSRHLREIGLLDDDLQLICSTALGRLSKPLKGNYPILVSQSGIELLNNVPLTVANEKITATIIQRPPFNVAISPNATDSLFASADVVWLRTQNGLEQLSARVAPARIENMRKRAEQRYSSDFALHRSGYELVSTTSDLDILLQTQRSLATIVRDSSMLLLILLVGSLLITVLTVGTIAPYVRTLSALRNRIAFLCDEAHLELYYQPIFDLANRRPVGCEVLTRLREGKQTWPSSSMIPAIQDANLEAQFDHAVTRKAIRELATHLPTGSSTFSVALNYFPKSVNPDLLIPVLTGALQAAGRSDLEIWIEITEHDLSSELITEAQRLKEKGFRIAVDDFGTGYSNLKSVTSLSPDLLKIDHSFVYDLEAATVRSNLIPEIVNIARAVNAQTVAEGIENLEQARLLAQAGIRYGQGYALAPPMKLKEFIALLNKFA